MFCYLHLAWLFESASHLANTPHSIHNLDLVLVYCSRPVSRGCVPINLFNVNWLEDSWTKEGEDGLTGSWGSELDGKGGSGSSDHCPWLNGSRSAAEFTDSISVCFFPKKTFLLSQSKFECVGSLRCRETKINWAVP